MNNKKNRKISKITIIFVIFIIVITIFISVFMYVMMLGNTGSNKCPCCAYIEYEDVKKNIDSSFTITIKSVCNSDNNLDNYKILLDKNKTNIIEATKLSINRVYSSDNTSVLYVDNDKDQRLNRGDYFIISNTVINSKYTFWIYYKDLGNAGSIMFNT